MAIRHRPMRPTDVRVCAEIVAAHPIIGPRYGSAIRDLPPAWLRLLGCEAFMPVVFEELLGSDVRILGAGVTAFVSDDFMREAKTPPIFWIGPALAKRVLRGDSPLLSDKELQKANSGEGLNLVVWQLGLSSEDVKRTDVTGEAMRAFVRLQRGFLLKELIVQPETAEHLLGLRNAGGLILNPADGSYAELHVNEPRDFLMEPCIIGLKRENARTRLGSFAFFRFIYRAPQCGFNRSEQRLLLSALDGGTDEELADKLQISVSAVKKKWHSIYGRVATRLPQLLPHSEADVQPSERGKAKKQRLLAYVRDHPEELRPVSRTLLKQNCPGTVETRV